MSNVDNMSEEDFDKAFDSMMSKTPEEFDASVSQSEETQLAESPSEVEETVTEQPQEELDTPADVESEASETSTEVEEENPVAEDSTKEESDEYDFSVVPRDQIIPRDINVNGMKVRATLDELEQGFKKGMNYTQKMQEIAPHRKDMNLMMDNGLTTADLNLLIEAKSGNKDALGKLLANANVDPLDVEVDDKAEYEPKDYAKDVPNVEMEQVKAEILQDITFSTQVEDALQTMPEDLYTMVSGEAGKMNALYLDVKSGLYAKAMPEVLKQQALNGKTEPTIDTYLKVAQQFINKAPQKEVKAPPENNPELNTKRKNAATTPASKPSGKKSLIKEDLDSMSDEDFDKAFQQMVGRSINEFS